MKRRRAKTIKVMLAGGPWHKKMLMTTGLPTLTFTLQGWRGFYDARGIWVNLEN